MNAKLLHTLPVMLLIISSCTSSHINAKRVNQDAFPPDFNKCKECTLIVLKRTGGVNPRGINNYLAKSFRKHYKGEFEMATPEEVDKNPKYQDKNKYRFIVSDQVRTGGSQVDNQKISNGMVTGHTIDYNYTYTMDFRIYDRLADKGYGSMGVSSNVPAKAINRTSVLLNKKLTE